MPGWLPLAHEEYDGLPCYYHASTRVVSWCEPYAVDLTQATKHEPPSTLQHEQEPLVDLLSAHHVREWDALREASPSGATAGSAAGLGQPRNERDKEEQLTPQEKLERELASVPRISARAFLARGSVMSSHRQPALLEIPSLILCRYAEEVLAAKVTFDLDVPTDGPWANPPHRCRVRILGVIVAEALSSQVAQARSVAAEDACLALCPLIYRENLRTLNIHQARIAKPALTDPSVADQLLLDDPRVFELDPCVGMGPGQIVHEYIVANFNSLLPIYDENGKASRITSSGSVLKGCEVSITVGPKTYVGFDARSGIGGEARRRHARNKAHINLLIATHPEIVTWGDMLRKYPSTQGKKPSLAQRSHAAEAIMRADKYTFRGKKEMDKDREVAARAPLGGAAAGPAGAEPAEREIIGAGSNFAYHWQRQFDLENARKAALSEGVRIENDTLFAFEFDRERQQVDSEKLKGLREAVAELEAAELTEQLRANEPSSLGGHDYLFEASRRGIEELQKYVPSEACSLSSDAQIWAPWKEGTKTHKMLTAIAQKTIEGRAGAAAQHLE